MNEKQDKKRIRRGFWVEESEDGIQRICFKPRHGGQKDVQKYTLAEFAAEMKKEKEKGD